jgi:ABC-type lipoprotein export system ATPase subunit
MVTHTPEVAKVADRIIFLEDGKVIDCDYKLEEE